jgi:hypothetical protein
MYLKNSEEPEEVSDSLGEIAEKQKMVFRSREEFECWLGKIGP